MLRDSPAKDDEVTGAAANLIPEPEPEKTLEPRRSENEDNDEPEEGDDEPTEINTPTRRKEEQETRVGEEIPERINTPLRQVDEAANSTTNDEELRPLVGSTTTEDTRRRSSRRSIPTDRYSAEFKLPENPRPREEQDHQ